MINEPSKDLKTFFYEMIASKPEVIDFIQYHAAEGIWFWAHKDSNNIWINNRFWETLGYSHEDHEHSWQKHLHEEDKDKVEELLELPINKLSGNYFSVIRFKNKKGTYQNLRFRLVLLKGDEDQALVLATIADITRIVQKQQLQDKCNEVGKIGYWELSGENLDQLTWSEVTKSIHEVSEDYSPTLEEGINFYPQGKSREKITELVESTMRTGAPYDAELQIETAKGNLIWVRTIGYPEMADGNCVRLFGTFQNIDNRKKNELAISKQSEFLNGVIENLLEGFILCNKEGSIRRINQSFTEILGFSDEELLDHNYPYPFLKDKTPRVFKDFFPLLISGESIETILVHKSGKSIPVRLSPSVLYDSNKEIIGVYSTVKDITQELTDKQKISEALSKLQSISDATTDVIIIGTDTKGLITYFNQGANNLLKYTEEEMVGQCVLDLHVDKELEVLSTKDRISQFDALTGVNTKDNHIAKSQWTYLRKDGSPLEVQLSVNPIHNEEGMVNGYLFMASDLTLVNKQKLETQALLNVTKDQNERLLNFAHIVSHNLRSHSSNLQMMLDLMAMESETYREDEYFKRMVQASENLKETISHLNEVVVMNHSIEENFKTINLLEICNSALKNIQGTAAEKEVEMLIDISPNESAFGVRAYLESIFLNFISNSIKYSSPSRKSWIKIATRSFENKVEIEFSDNGIGIDLERHRNKIFGMYKTFHGNPDARGIGLFISKNQIEAMGGSISVSSKPNVGTTFRIELNN